MLIPISEPSPRRGQPDGFALFRLGFRPFYLGATLLSAVSMAMWMWVLEGGRWHGAMPALAWHQHEMIFGFALTVIAGFLLTAGRVWTGLATPQGWPLALLVLHWLLARVLLFTGPLPLAALVDVLFPFVVAAVMARVLIAAGSRRNYFAIAVLAALGLANLGFYVELTQRLEITPGTSIHAALYLVVVMVIMIGGRVVPSFTASALPRAGVVVRSIRLDPLAVGSSLAAFALDLMQGPPVLTAGMAVCASVLHAWRQWRWKPLATAGVPILWILHASHAWIPAGFALLAMAALGWIGMAVPLHAFGVGAVGGMIIGMVTRTALGHTGRALRAGWPETAAYVLILLAALARVLAGLVPPAAYPALIWLAGHFWALGFLIYFVVYLPRLMRSRLDGKPG